MVHHTRSGQALGEHLRRPLRSPTEIERDELTDAITANPAFRHIADYLQHAKALGLDPTDADVIRRVMEAGAAAYIEARRRAYMRLDSRTLRAYRTRNTDHPDVVYYMRDGNLVKIGTTVNVTRRLSEIGAQGVLAIEPGDIAHEHARHRQFAHLREHHEWFRLDEELAGHISNLRVEFEEHLGRSVEIWMNERAKRDQRLKKVIPTLYSDAIFSLPKSEQDGFVTMTEAARIVGVSKQTICDWRRCGRLPVAALTERGHRLYLLSDVFSIKQPPHDPDSN